MAASADAPRRKPIDAATANFRICKLPQMHAELMVPGGSRLRSQHDLGGSGAAGIDVLECARPLGERPLFDPVQRAEPAGGNSVKRLAKFQRCITIGAGD